MQIIVPVTLDQAVVRPTVGSHSECDRTVGPIGVLPHVSVHDLRNNGFQIRVLQRAHQELGSARV